jgi:hypothetical protein
MNNFKVGSIEDEFEFLEQEEIEVPQTSFVDDSNAMIAEAKEFMRKTKLYPDRTYQGIPVTSISNSLTVGKSDIMTWNHVKFTINVNNLKDISGGKLEELTIPSFVEEIESIGDRDGIEFGYNQAGRNRLRNIILPSNLIVIAPNTFAFYKKLECVSIESNCKLLYLGQQAFACCESLHTLDLRNCEYLDEIPSNCFTNSSIEVLKLNRNVKQIKELKNTNIKEVHIDTDVYNIDEFNYRLQECNGVFWEAIGYEF